jgi:hypothetical protein
MTGILFHVQGGSRTQKAAYLMDTGRSSPGLKRPGREDDHSLPSSAEVKNAWSYTFTPLYIFMARSLITSVNGMGLN